MSLLGEIALEQLHWSNTKKEVEGGETEGNRVEKLKCISKGLAQTGWALGWHQGGK